MVIVRLSGLALLVVALVTGNPALIVSAAALVALPSLRTPSRPRARQEPDPVEREIATAKRYYENGEIDVETLERWIGRILDPRPAPVPIKPAAPTFADYAAVYRLDPVDPLDSGRVLY